MTSELKTASVLAFERKLDPSDALLFAGDWAARHDPAAWSPLTIREKSVRGTISNRLNTKEQDPAKLNASIENPNLQRVDVASLPAAADTLKIQFTLRVLGGVGQPSACNHSAYRARLQAAIDRYVNDYGFGELARCYAANLANGRFLWRNRIGAEQIEVQVAKLKDGRPETSWQFDALAHKLRDLTDPPASETVALSQLAEVIALGLSGTTSVLLQICAFVRLGCGQEVFPSQELILEKAKSDKSKTLYDVNGVAAIHSQKIGNALRTIDTWYPGAADNGPIAVEPYGSVTTQGRAWRQPKEKADFYHLLDAWVLKEQAIEAEQKHFVVATLIRGGVFGEKAD